MTYDAIIVGAGAGGLTAAAYLAKSGRRVLLLEKEAQCGGLVNSFERNGFVFDGGIRALEDAGVLFTMLRQLGIALDFIKNRISIGIEDKFLTVDSNQAMDDYGRMLTELYPESKKEIAAIVADLRVITRYMNIQYGIDNPLFLDPKKDGKYFIKKVIPWMFSYALTVGKVMKKNQPVLPYLKNFTKNPALLDIITQHFFAETPAYFALSYFKIFQEYYYPRGGTGAFTHALVNFIKKHGGEIRTETKVEGIDLREKQVRVAGGEGIAYRQLVWAADQKSLYAMIDESQIGDEKARAAVTARKQLIADKKGSDSVFTLYLSVDLDRSYFANIATGHFFYTPSRAGQTAAGEMPLNGEKKETLSWLQRFLGLTTYEIAIPVLRDSNLAPAGKSGLVISFLFDYELAKVVQEHGWDKELREKTTKMVIEILDKSIYPGLAGKVIESFTSTPLTIQSVAGTTDGAITGWSFRNQPMPAENRLASIANAVNTPIPDVCQAGQWTYSPSGFPVALITGKLAADKANKQLRK